MSEEESESPSVKKARQHRSFVLQEVVESEREYVRRMQIAFEDYYLYISSGAPDVPQQLKVDQLPIFSTLPEIYAFHKDTFLPELEACQLDMESILQCFVRHADSFATYLQYCKNKPTSDSARVDHEAWFQVRQSALGHKLIIEDLLIGPVQRLTKYQLLIKDMLKDTRKIGEDTTSIEEALAVMEHIPKETNNIICISLLRGIPRVSILGHGSLWIQDVLTFWDFKAVKGEPRQVYLFDHRILIAMPPDADGFFKYLDSIKTLNGSVVEAVEGDAPLKFGFKTAEKQLYHFQAPSSESKAAWVSALDSILNAQSKMMRALVFGKPASPRMPMRHTSLSMDWSDSDSSIDSMPSTEEEEGAGDEDWPAQTGFHALKENQRKPRPPSQKRRSPKKRQPDIRVKSVDMDTGGDDKLKRNRASTAVPLSSTFSSLKDLNELRSDRSFTLSATLGRHLMSSRWFAKKNNSSRAQKTSVQYPLSDLPSTLMLLRSPGALPRMPPPQLTRPKSPSFPSPPDKSKSLLYIAKEDLPPIAERLYRIPPGQVCVAMDRSQEDVWRVKLCSGENAGTLEWVQRNCLVVYSAPISGLPYNRVYSLKKDLGSGRFSRVRLGKLKLTGATHALKVMSSEVLEESYYRELCIGCQLRHKNLVVYTGGLEGKDRVITMEHIVGRPLLDYLMRKSSVSETAVCQLMGQLLDGLHYLHSHTIMHLDVRPDNILVQMSVEGDTVKLIDYGAARHTWAADGDMPLHHDYEPTADYQFTPPEVFQAGTLEPRTDIWGVGVIIFLLLYGRTPFAGESAVRTVANITSLSYTFPSEAAYSSQARELLRAIFTDPPRNRPSAQEARVYKWFIDSKQFSGNLLNLSQLMEFVIPVPARKRV